VESVPPDPVIELAGLSVRFGGRPILDSLSGALSGRAIGLLGPNGAGKSTLIQTLLGFHRPAAGSARILGKDIHRDARALKAEIGYMPENDAYIAGMTAVRFVKMMAELSGLPPSAATERAHEALFWVGLGEARYRKLETFSLGMKQLAKLAQAIVHAPKLIFLDEPTNGLDPPARQRMIRLVREIAASGEARIVLSSHLLRYVEECCDEVIVLKDGRIATTCNIEEERRTNRKFLEVETRGEPAAFIASVGELGCEYALHEGGRMKIVLAPSVEIRDLYRIASEKNVQIRRLDYKRDSLQDIFLKAMEVSPGRL
jgi:ABC-2 type transport system ATP-binding protein